MDGEAKRGASVRKLIPNGLHGQDRTEWAVILNDEEFDLLEGLLKSQRALRVQRLLEEKADGLQVCFDAEGAKAEEPEPIEAGQLWQGKSGGRVVEIEKSDEADSIVVGFFPPPGFGFRCSEDEFRDGYARLPYRRSSGVD